MSDLEEALANPSGVTSLHHDFDDEGPLDHRVAALTGLTELHLRNVPPDLVLPEQLLALPIRQLGMAGKDDHLVVPELVRRMAIERLHVWDIDAADLPPLPALRHLEIVVKDPAREVAVLAERFGRLVHLEVWGGHLPHGEIPADIERFGMLEALYFVSCGISNLPPQIAKLPVLRELGIRGCPIKKLPEVVLELPRLAALQIQGDLPGLPPELARMSGLRRLELGFSLNKGMMVSKYDETAKLKPLPRVLGELTNLERLGIGSCGVTEIDVLRPLGKLRSLDLSWAGMTTLAPLANLTELEELDLDHCGKVKDFSPLAGLTKLRKLSLDGTEPRSLDFVRGLSALKELHIEGVETEQLDALYTLDVELHADDEIQERFAARAALRDLPTLAELEQQLAARDPATIEKVLGQIAAYVEAASTRKANALLAWGIPVERDEEDDDDAAEGDDEEDDEDFDEDDDDDDDDAEGDDDGVVHAGPYLPVLDLALDRHLAAVSPVALAKLFCALFRDTGESFHAARRIAFELVSRGEVTGIDDAQCTLVDGFIKANEHYDTGHREHGNTVHDAVIDHVFPLLRARALVKLLVWASDGHLDEDHGDAMLGLFAPALARADEAGRTELIARLERYVDRAIEYRNGPQTADRVWAMLAPLATGALGQAIAAMRARLDVKLAAARAREELKQRLSEPATCAAAIAEAAKVTDAELEELQGALWRANEVIELPRSARRQLYVLWQRRERDDGIAGAIATAARTTGVDELRDDLSVLAGDRGGRGKILREAVLKALAIDDYPEQAIDRLRVLASELDGMPRDVADSHELRAVLFGAAQGWDQEGFERGVALLEALPRYVPPPAAGDDDDDDDSDGGSPSDFASMIANLAECSEFELLGRVARQLHKLQLTGMPLERVLAQLVAVAIVGDDPGAYTAIAPLIPRDVTWDILAYNLACKAAKNGDRATTLKYTARALELGKSPDQFLADSDFEDLHEDGEFVALLDQHR